MAQLNVSSGLSSDLAPETHWTAAQTRAQYATVAWLRWRILMNALRRKGGAAELVTRIILYPLFAGFALGPTALAFGGAYYFVNSGHIAGISLLLWITFGLCQLLNIQLGQPGSTFDPTQLIRFPLHISDYTAIRLFFGLLSPANIIGTLISLAIAAGITAADPQLWLYAFAALAVFAAANVLFSRMVFAWVDRWLATRRAREVFTALIFAFSIAVQWLNFTYNPAYNRHSRTHNDPGARITAAVELYHRAQHYVQFLPPELTARSLVAAHLGQTTAFAGLTLACAAFAAAFLAIFTLRMRTEFRGENLSDAANAVRSKPAALRKPSSPPRDDSQPALTSAPANSHRLSLSPVLAAVTAKEFLYLRRNIGLFYGLVAPLVFLLLFVGRLTARSGATWVFPTAIAYSLLGIIPLSFNSFGLEGTGAQLYFLAPVRLRDILLAKNLIHFAVAFVEALAVYAIVSYAAAPPRLDTALVALLWSAATLLFATSLGNRRSLSAPKQIDLSRASRKQASGLSALLAMGILLLSASLAAAVFGAALWFQLTWPLVPTFALFFAAALWVYLHSLGSIDTYAQDHREDLFTELGKKT